MKSPWEQIEDALRRRFPTPKHLNGWKIEGIFNHDISGSFGYHPHLLLTRGNQHQYVNLGFSHLTQEGSEFTGKEIIDRLHEATSPIYDLSDMD